MKEKRIKVKDVKNLPPIEEIHGLNIPPVEETYDLNSLFIEEPPCNTLDATISPTCRGTT